MALDAFALVLLLFGIGALCTRLELFPPSGAEVLHRFVLYVCVPAAVLRFAPRLRFDPHLVGLAVLPWLMLAAGIALVWPLARWLNLGREERAVLLLCAPLANTSFLGFPLIEAMLGKDALPYAVAYDQFGSFLMVSTWGLWVLARYSGDAPPTPRRVLRRIVSFPPFPALVLALTVVPEQPPAVIAAVLARLSDALLPAAALAVGLQIRLRVPAGEVKPLLAGLAVKLVALPALAWAVAPWVGLSGVPAQAAILETAMPAMITAGALASSHNLAPGLAAALVGYGVVLAAMTLPLWSWLLH